MAVGKMSDGNATIRSAGAFVVDEAFIRNVALDI
jgi:hypothetical protein